MLAVNYTKKGSGWLAGLPAELSPEPFDGEDLVESRASDTNNTGKHPLWQGYEAVPEYPNAENKFRSANKVRTTSLYGRFYVQMVKDIDAKVVVEFGAAFGVSGMYWLSGLKRTGGQLYSYEPNDVWSTFAEKNMEAMGAPFLLSKGTFEEFADKTLKPNTVDIGFIDAIHTSDFVFSQLEILKKFLKAGSIVVFDDINFSPDMRACWRTIAASDFVETSVTLSRRIGVVQLKKG